MYKRVVISALLVTLFLVGETFAGFFEFVDPRYEENVLREEVENGEEILVNINTVAVDTRGNLYYLKSERQAVMEEGESFTWEEMEEIEYPVKIIQISLEGEETVFAEGSFPLKATIAGMLFNRTNLRLLIFVQTLAIKEECLPLFSSTTFSGEALGSRSSLSTEEAEKKVWNWSGLENCFYEKLSILDISGFNWVAPF